MGLNEALAFFFFLSVLRPKYPKDSHLDTFNRMLPVMRNSIAGSVDGLCMDAIARNLMTFPERAGILEGGNKFKQASQFLEHFALKIEVSPEVLIQFMDMLTDLGTCNGVVQELSKLGLVITLSREFYHTVRLYSQLQCGQGFI